MPCTLIITRYSYCSVPAKATGHAVTQLGCLAPSTSVLTSVEQKKTCIVLWWGDGCIMTGPPRLWNVWKVWENLRNIWKPVPERMMWPSHQHTQQLKRNIWKKIVQKLTELVVKLTKLHTEKHGSTLSKIWCKFTLLWHCLKSQLVCLLVATKMYMYVTI